MKINQDFLGGGKCKTKKPSIGEDGYSLKLHNSTKHNTDEGVTPEMSDCFYNRCTLMIELTIISFH